MNPNEEYWRRVRARAKDLGSDGCTAVAEWRQDCCFEHDVHCRTGMTLSGVPITRIEADAVFRACIQKRSALRVLSPMSWWRWAGVRAGAWWENRKRA